ncbi:MAG: SRPBCC family protein [Mediterranea sp.]|jgi:hypothetical protein|nr:SRPBCC family protein [Mediterranea sp.]
MTKFESGVKIVSASQESIYNVLSDPSKLEQLKAVLPQDKVKEIQFDGDNITFNAPPVGSITLSLVEKEPCKCIKYAATTSPMPFSLWIQIVPVSEHESKIRLTVGLDINPFMKAMVQKPLADGLEKMAEAFAVIPYERL